MSCEITADSITCSGMTRRTIPILQRYSSSNITVASGGGVLVTSDMISPSQSIGTTGFIYQNGLYRNLSGQTLVCHVSYALLWSNNFDGARMSWLQLDNLSERYAMHCIQSVSVEPCQTGSVVIIIPHNSYLRLWCFQQTGSNKTLVALYGMPYLKITII
jgi:hypothetical protein